MRRIHEALEAVETYSPAEELFNTRPVWTPPNASVYSSGYVPITAMMRYGILPDVVGFVVITTLVLLLGPRIF